MKIVFTPRLLQYRAKTSAESTEPIRLPKCGVLFTKGRADVMSTLRLPGSGSIGGLAMLEETIERQPRRELKVGSLVNHEMSQPIIMYSRIEGFSVLRKRDLPRPDTKSPEATTFLAG